MNNYFSKAIHSLGLGAGLVLGCTPTPSSARQLVHSLEEEAREICTDANYHPDEYLATRKVAWTAARRDALLELARYPPDCVTWKCREGFDVAFVVDEKETPDCRKPNNLELKAYQFPSVQKERDALLRGTGLWEYHSWAAKPQ